MCLPGYSGVKNPSPWLPFKDSFKTLKQSRREKEGKIKKQGSDNVYPGWDVLKEEEREESPVITFVIKDMEGNVVNRLTGPTSAGFHRVNWNLRYSSLSSTGGSGPFVTPGKYAITAEKRIRDEVMTLGSPQMVEVVPILTPSLPAQDREAVLQFYMTAGELQRAIRGANGKANEVLSQLVEIKQALNRSGKGTTQLFEEARGLELKLKDTRELLLGNTAKSRYNEPDRLSIMSRVNSAMNAMGSTYGPTQTHRRDYEIAQEEFETVLGQVKKLIEVDFVNLQRNLEAAGLPWTSGRPIPELKK